jgi:hypothetical protein
MMDRSFFQPGENQQQIPAMIQRSCINWYFDTCKEIFKYFPACHVMCMCSQTFNDVIPMSPDHHCPLPAISLVLEKQSYATERTFSLDSSISSKLFFPEVQ